MKSIAYYLILVQLLFLYSCSLKTNSAWTSLDTWYNEPTQTEITPWEWEEIKYYEVNSSLQEEAQSHLINDSIKEITKKQITNYLNQTPTINKISKFFLVRAVYLNEYTGSFNVYRNNNELWVYHGSLGKYPVPMKRRALIVMLKQKPEVVYITCMMDE